MAVADPIEIGCRLCGAEPGEKCHARNSPRPGVRRPHAIRWADAGLEEAVAGWVPRDPTATVLDLDAARIRRLARGNGANFT